uniref:KIX domain-containing protein n=1 Tax=Parastrongyloides trichosuri TaxID=131310 RepID=A0A0N4ZAW5_PARTI
MDSRKRRLDEENVKNETCSDILHKKTSSVSSEEQQCMEKEKSKELKKRADDYYKKFLKNVPSQENSDFVKESSLPNFNLKNNNNGDVTGISEGNSQNKLNWRNTIQNELRLLLRRKLLLSFAPNESLEEWKSNYNSLFTSLESYCESSETKIFMESCSKTNYFENLAHKIYEIQKELRKIKLARLGEVESPGNNEASTEEENVSVQDADVKISQD